MDSRPRQKHSGMTFLRRKRPSEAPLAWEESARGHWTNMQNTLGYNNILGLGGANGNIALGTTSSLIEDK